MNFLQATLIPQTFEQVKMVFQAQVRRGSSPSLGVEHQEEEGGQPPIYDNLIKFCFSR